MTAKQIFKKSPMFRSRFWTRETSEINSIETNIFAIDREKKRKINVFKSSSLVSVGIMILLACFWFWLDSINDAARAQVNVEQKLTNQEYQNKDGEKKIVPTAPIEDNVPNRVEIKDLRINMDVVPQVTKQGAVEVSTTKANYLVGSGVIGEKNNIVVFAHKRNGMFGNLSQIKVGTKIILKSKDRVGEYEVVDGYETRSNDMTVVMPDGYYGLTLYTCNRWDDSHRYVVRAREVRTYESEK